jgi:hypothetical protein
MSLQKEKSDVRDIKTKEKHGTKYLNDYLDLRKRK